MVAYIVLFINKIQYNTIIVHLIGPLLTEGLTYDTFWDIGNLLTTLHVVTVKNTVFHL